MTPLTFSKAIMKYPLVLISFFPCLLAAQRTDWSRMPSVGFYFTPLKMERYAFSSGFAPNETIFEHTANLTLTVPVNQKLRVGMQYMSVATRVTREPVDRSHLLGVLGQYNFRARKRLGVYLEAGYTFGNFCPCGEAETYTSDTLNHFVNWGFGINFPVIRRLHVKAGFINYSPIKKQNDIYNWTQPFIGINYYVFPGYRTPFGSRFQRRNEPLPRAERKLLWTDPKKRTWNIGLSSSGGSIRQHRAFPGQTEPLYRYVEFTVTPRINYWVKQYLMVGVQGTFYHFEDNYLTYLPETNGWGVGAQSRLYPLALGKKNEFRAIRIGKRANWNLSPMLGVDLYWANYSWAAPLEAGNEWRYVSWQPSAGFVLAYKRWFNLFMSIGPSLEAGNNPVTSPANGARIFGLEYNFTK